MNDSPYRSPKADETSEPLKPVRSTNWGVVKAVLALAAIVGTKP